MLTDNATRQARRDELLKLFKDWPEDKTKLADIAARYGISEDEARADINMLCYEGKIIVVWQKRTFKVKSVNLNA